MGIPPNVAGLLCYAAPACCAGIIFSLVVVVVEKQSRFLRFHAFQSLLLHGVVIAVAIAIFLLHFVVGLVSGVLAGLLAGVLHLLLLLAILAGDIFLMVKAYAGEEFEIPTLGPIARQWV
jgi:uncharacterized membrane protein